MRKALTVVVLAALISATPIMVPEADANPAWLAGAAFAIGGATLALVLGSRYEGPPAYYWRTDRELAYRGYHCTDACFVDHGVYYHDAACPVVRYHLRRYGYDGDAMFERYAPRYQRDGYYGDYGYDYGYRSYGYSPYGYSPYGYDQYGYDQRYNRDYYRYDRRYDRRNDRRYDPRYNQRYNQRNDRRYDRRNDRRDDRRHDRRDDRRDRRRHNDPRDRHRPGN